MRIHIPLLLAPIPVRRVLMGLHRYNTRTGLDKQLRNLAAGLASLAGPARAGRGVWAQPGAPAAAAAERHPAAGGGARTSSR